MEPRYKKDEYVQFTQDSHKGSLTPVVFKYPLKIINIKQTRTNDYIYRLENNHDYYEDELKPVSPPVLKTKVIGREIQNILVADANAEWLSELAVLKERRVECDKDTEMVDEVITFITRSAPEDGFHDVTPDGYVGFDLTNKDGHVYGAFWDTYKHNYDCIIEELMGPSQSIKR